jgi:hypothetical protein
MKEELFKQYYNRYTILLEKCRWEHKDFDRCNREIAELNEEFIATYNLSGNLYPLQEIEIQSDFNLLLKYSGWEEVINVTNIYKQCY